MQRRGRKPLETRHVQRLAGSDFAKQRLEVILDTMRGAITVPEACERLGVGEARFHDLRRQWLQESLELLEPRRTGRPPKQREVYSPREAELASENARLQQQLQLSEARREVSEVLAVTGDPPAKKKRTSRRVERARGGKRPPR